MRPSLPPCPGDTKPLARRLAPIWQSASRYACTLSPSFLPGYLPGSSCFRCTDLTPPIPFTVTCATLEFSIFRSDAAVCDVTSTSVRAAGDTLFGYLEREGHVVPVESTLLFGAWQVKAWCSEEDRLPRSLIGSFLVDARDEV